MFFQLTPLHQRHKINLELKNLSKENIMDAINHVGLMAQLGNEHCELNHGPETHSEKHPAVDYIIQPFGYNVNEIEEVSVRDMIVPVCAECAESLQGNDWTLLYCFECCSSQWINRSISKNRYRHSILWLHGCPKCSNEFGGLYFSDIKAIFENPVFVGQCKNSQIA